MYYLDEHIGKNIVIDLTEEARQDRNMKAFYETHKSNAYIMNKLVSVDPLGAWLEGYQEATKFRDEYNNPIPEDEQTQEWITVSVLIPWNYLRGYSLFRMKTITIR